MKKLFALAVVLSLTCTPVVLFAQDADPGAPGIPDVTMVDENVGSHVGSIIEAFQGKHWAVAIGLLLMFVVWFVVEFFWKSIPSSWVPWLSAGLGVVMSIGVALSTGIGWLEAILGGLLTGTSASGLWSLIGKATLGKVRNERKKEKAGKEEAGKEEAGKEEAGKEEAGNA